MGPRFRLATDADIDIYRGWFTDPVLAGRLSAPTPEWCAHVRAQGQALWVAGDAGGLLAVFQTEQDGDATWIDAVIDPARRGKGEMAAILQAFLDGPLAGAPRLIAEVETDNSASLALLRRCAFTEQEEATTPGFLRFELTRAGHGS